MGGGDKRHPFKKFFGKTKPKRNRKYDIHQIHTIHPYQFLISTVGVHTDVSEEMHWKLRCQRTELLFFF